MDAGGTHSRLLVGLDGTIRGRGRAGRGQSASSSADPAVSFINAVSASLREAGPVSVAAAVFGVAGAGAAGLATTEQTVLRAGPGGRSDSPDAPRSATTSSWRSPPIRRSPAALALIAGTGAVAATIRDGRIERRCDGYGWLLGDEGSAVWLGIAGLRAALAALDGRGRATVLTERLAAALHVPAGSRQALIGAAYSMLPAELGSLAPRVCAAAEEGDAAAVEIVSTAASRLLESLAAWSSPRRCRPR